MADVTISGLPNASTLAGTERVPMDQSGVTVDASSQEIANLATAASVGLGNVNNTSDANKPVSAATQTALDGKAATSHTQAASTITGLAAVATSGSASDLAAGTLPAARLPDTTVAAGSYGSSTLVPVITVGADGRITAASTAAVSGGGGGTVTSVTGTAPITSSGGTTPAISIAAATTSAAGSMSGADKTKLDGITSGATTNSSDATLLARANHTGTQAASTITGLGGAALLSIGTTAGTVAAGDDSRITGALSTATAATTYQPLTTNLSALGTNGTAYYLGRGNHTGTQAFSTLTGVPCEIGVACSDETTDLTTGTAKVTLRMPYAMTLTAVRLNVNTAPTGSALVVNIKEAGATVFSTKPQIDAASKTSVGSGTTAVISDSSLASDAEITIDIDQIGGTVKGRGLKIWLIGTRA